MKYIGADPSNKWSIWQKIGFRFCCIYFLLQIQPWSWTRWMLGHKIPFLSNATEIIEKMFTWIRDQFNHSIFHFVKTDVINNGSGDTSFDLLNIYSFGILAITGTIIWSILDKERLNYSQANFWLRNVIRYNLIIVCFWYGIIKLFLLQMVFPTESQLSTPLGDLLPMRFIWLFIGYSSPYQIFSGIMEILAGFLLFNRKSITLGVLIATAFFINVVMLNLAYDIPAKMLSIHVLFYCLYLLGNDGNRICRFLLLNKPASTNELFKITLSKKWFRIARIVFKVCILLLFFCEPIYTSNELYKDQYSPDSNIKKFPEGIYDVMIFAINHDTIPDLPTDSLRWKDMVFDNTHSGSIGTTDTSLIQRYRRGYFNYSVDTVHQTLSISKTLNSSSLFAQFNFKVTDSNTIELSGKRKDDSLFILLNKSYRHFQLADKQFHWIWNWVP